MQQTYEIRLLNGDGGMAIFYVTQCMDDDDAKNQILRMNGKNYERYELWQGQRKVCEGPRPDAAA